jgi:hypothetical protein
VEVLRNFLGNLGSGVIRLAVAVGILAAIAIFIVRPALDTTKQISRETNESIQRSFSQSFGKNGAGLEDVEKTLQEVKPTVEREVRKSFHVAKAHGPGDPKRLIKCIQHAAGDVHKIQRCTVKF